MNINFKKIIAASFLLGGFFLMLGLGFWQIERLQWKNDIIHELDRVYSASNLPLFSADNIRKAASEDRTYLYGHIQGKPLWDKEIFYGPVAKDKAMGFEILTPVTLKKDQYIWVNRGWISEEERKVYAAPSHKNIEFTGLLRQPEWNYFTPNNSPENDIWTKLDVSQMSEARDLNNALPFILYAHRTSKNLAPVQLLEEKWYPRNKHTQYATFWFSMAFFFILFFGYYAYKMRRPN